MNTLASNVRWLLLVVCWLGCVFPVLAQNPDPSALFKAAEAGDVVGLKRQLAQGVAVNAADADGWTALMVAASSGRLVTVQALLKAGADINARTSKGETPLMAAALSGNIAIVKLLLAEGADKMATSAQGITAAEVAQRARHPDLAALLAVPAAKTVPAPAKTSPPNTNARKIEIRENAAADAFQAGRYSEAVSLFRDVTLLAPKHALAWHFLGQSMEKTGDLPGAWKAYGRSLEVQPEGQAATRTRQMLTRLPLPDTTKIVLPSGLTLFDYLGMLDKRASKEDPAALLSEASGYIREYGPYPPLVKLRDRLLNKEIGAIRLDSAEAARAALPRVAQLQDLTGDTLKLMALEAQANHLAGNYPAAQTAYSRWLQTAAAQDTRRAGMAQNLLKAQQRQEPELMISALQDCDACSGSNAPIPGAAATETLVTFSGDAAGQEVSVEIPIAFGGKFGARFNLREKIEPAITRLLESKLPAVRFGDKAPSDARIGLRINIAIYGIHFRPYYSDLTVDYKAVIAFTPRQGERSEKTIDASVKGKYDYSPLSKSHNEAASATAIPDLIRESLVRELSTLLDSEDTQILLKAL